MKKCCISFLLLVFVALCFCGNPAVGQEASGNALQSQAQIDSKLDTISDKLSYIQEDLADIQEKLASYIAKEEEDTIFDKIDAFICQMDDLLWGWPMIILLGVAHIFLTFRLRFIQRYIPLGIKLSISKDSATNGDISQFGALAIALAATIGTGNIIGVATAIVKGGPGAVLWCWVFGVLGISTKYAESLISVKYRVKDSDGKTHGGAMYAIERGMKCKPLAVMFAIFTGIACFGIGNMTQSNAVAENMIKTLNIGSEMIPTWKAYIGLIEAVLIAIVVMGGLKAVSRLCETLVPFMAAFYVFGCIAILCVCHSFILPAIKIIITEAYSTRAITGGALGTAMMIALRYGVARGLFSNESGLGSAPIVAACAQTRNTVRQALISSTGTFWDTVIICAMTGICVVASQLQIHNGAVPLWNELSAPGLTSAAFAFIPFIGKYILMIALVVFAYTTILGWYCYGEQAFHYLGGKWCMPIFRTLYVIAIFIGAVCSLDTVWNISDIGNGLMAIPNIIVVLVLSGVIVSETKKYLWTPGGIDQTDPACTDTAE